jgi:tRNA-2-methylthio-N6-dimethylallyladenosine synthase
VAAVPGVERVRFTSPYPKDFTDDVIEAMATLPHVCEQVHLPVQVGDDVLLKRMHRGYTLGQYREIVGKLRAAMPEVVITTDLMLGFPGETAEQVENTYRFVEEIRFDSRSCSPTRRASPRRPRRCPTRSGPRKDAPAGKADRDPEPITVEINRGQIGRVFEVLVRAGATRPRDVAGASRAAAKPSTSPPAATSPASSSGSAPRKGTSGVSAPT